MSVAGIPVVAKNGVHLDMQITNLVFTQDNVLRDTRHERAGIGRAIHNSAIDQNMGERSVGLNKPEQMAITQTMAIRANAHFGRLRGRAGAIGLFLLFFRHRNQRDALE